MGCRSSSAVLTRGWGRQSAVLWSGSAVHWGVASLGLLAVLLAPFSLLHLQPQVPLGTPVACPAQVQGFTSVTVEFLKAPVGSSLWLIREFWMAAQPSGSECAGLSTGLSEVWLYRIFGLCFWHNSCSSSDLHPFHSPAEKDVLCVLPHSNRMFEVSFLMVWKWSWTNYLFPSGTAVNVVLISVCRLRFLKTVGSWGVPRVGEHSALPQSSRGVVLMLVCSLPKTHFCKFILSNPRHFYLVTSVFVMLLCLSFWQMPLWDSLPFPT